MKNSVEIKAKRPKHKTKWIICTKWSFYDKGTKSMKHYWAPVGDKDLYTTTGTIHGRVYDYSSQKEAKKGLKDIANLFENLNNHPLVTCEVRYVPKKIKMYDQSWFDKYVLNEVKLKVIGNKRGSEQDLNP